MRCDVDNGKVFDDFWVSPLRGSGDEVMPDTPSSRMVAWGYARTDTSGAVEILNFWGLCPFEDVKIKFGVMEEICYLCRLYNV